MSLEEIDAYIKSISIYLREAFTKRFKKKGIGCEMNAILLKKIEELTIEMISLKKTLCRN